METESPLANLVKSPLHIFPRGFWLIQFAEIRTKNEPGMVTKFLSVVPRPILGAFWYQLPIHLPSGGGGPTYQHPTASDEKATAKPKKTTSSNAAKMMSLESQSEISKG